MGELFERALRCDRARVGCVVFHSLLLAGRAAHSGRINSRRYESKGMTMSAVTARQPKSKETEASRGEQLVSYIAGTQQREYPPEVVDAALRALVDHLGCAVG